MTYRDIEPPLPDRTYTAAELSEEPSVGRFVDQMTANFGDFIETGASVGPRREVPLIEIGEEVLAADRSLPIRVIEGYRARSLGALTRALDALALTDDLTELPDRKGELVRLRMAPLVAERRRAFLQEAYTYRSDAPGECVGYSLKLVSAHTGEDPVEVEAAAE